MRLILDYGFNILNLHSIYLRVFSHNTRAIKSYEKVGFKYAGKLRETNIMGGKKYDEIFMDILEDEYQSVYIKAILESE